MALHLDNVFLILGISLYVTDLNMQIIGAEIVVLNLVGEDHQIKKLNVCTCHTNFIINVGVYF